MKGMITKMKKLAYILFFICMFSGVNCLAQSSQTTDYPWVYETFDNSDLGKVVSDGAGLSFSEDGALKITVGSNITNGGGGYKINTNLKNGETYKLSFLVKLEEGANIPRSGSVNNAYNSEGEIAKLYGAIREGTTLKQTLDFGEASYWSNEEYVRIEHEFTYEYEGTNASISFRVGERSDRGGRNLQGGNNLIYCIDNVMLIPVSDTELVSDLTYSYVENESNTIDVSYNFTGETNNSLTVLLAENEGEWEINKILGVGENIYRFQIPPSLNGKKCKIAVYPADGTNAGGMCEILIESLKLNVIEDFNITDDEITANVVLCYPDLKNVIVFVCQYSQDNEMIDIKYQTVECGNNEETEVTLISDINDNMKTASLFIWEGSDFKTSEMLSLVDEIVLEKDR